jgi:hypothetical protein
MDQEDERASLLINENWACVVAVTEALLAKSRLTGQEVRAIVKASKS